MSLLDELNPQQREAVLATEGPALVLAGAGSGKTRVITYRVAHLIAQGVPPESLLSVTFTNKAGEEMRARVERLLQRSGLSGASSPWIGTFHAFCARLLRRDAPRLGLRRDFAIYDDDDQISVVKTALKQLGYEERSYPARDVLSRISHAKNRGQNAEQLAASAGRDDKWRIVGQVFDLYELILRKSGAVDFDDLLLKAVAVLSQFPDARAHWAGRYQHIQVDEYQDANRIQYELVRLLSSEHRNLCVVGDEDQSIYSWRGADVGNILRFAEDFPGARVIRLEQNYRSTQNILDAAGAVVSNNAKRIGKTLVATRGGGAKLRFFQGMTAADEADFAAERITELRREELNTRMAVLYRTNFQSRAFEESLRRAGLRYKVVGGFSFYQRAEVKDTMAYVRLAMNPEDDVALLRVLNTPPRGIGAATVASLQALAQQQGVSLWTALEYSVEGGSGRAVNAMKGFKEIVEHLRGELGQIPPAEFLEHVLDRTGYLTMLEQQDFAEDSSRVENVRELVNAVAEGTERDETLSDFLDRTALVSDADDLDEVAPVTLLTLHSAKGLEFDHVFLTGLEEGLFPHSRSLNDPDAIEEERRLCYVGMTRAKDTLTLTRATYRRMYGNNLSEAAEPSRFLDEVPQALLQLAPGSMTPTRDAPEFQGRRYVTDPDFDETPQYVPARRAAAAGRSMPRNPKGRGSTIFGAPPVGPRDPLIGARVRHAKYGVGTVIGVEGEEDERKLTVSFSDYGTKKLIERFAQLKRI